MEGVGERRDAGAARDLARELERGLNGVGAGGPGELNLVVELAGREHGALELFKQVALGLRVQVEGVRDVVARDVVDQRLLQRLWVVPVVERAGAREKVDVATALLVPQLGAPTNK